jgi:hypothetical protein
MFSDISNFLILEGNVTEILYFIVKNPVEILSFFFNCIYFGRPSLEHK